MGDIREGCSGVWNCTKWRARNFWDEEIVRHMPIVPFDTDAVLREVKGLREDTGLRTDGQGGAERRQESSGSGGIFAAPEH